ncbi:hypothetical protein DFH28DRAFT_1083153 [Melampsora americana]|nr:hypothetical protein DFH28DRAFT_1083153 [Melampsora americana]
MRPPALNLKNCRVKKVFTNEVNNEDLSFASSSERSSLELEFGGLSPARLSMFNLDEPLPSPILERPLRIRRRVRNVDSVVSANSPSTSQSSHIESQSPFRFSGPPLVMNPDGSVRSPHRRPALIIKSRIKKRCPPPLSRERLNALLSQQRKRRLYIIVEEVEEE